jgi:hypothetical protein
MKKILALAAVPMIIAAGCATPASDRSNGGAATIAGGKTYYCWKERLYSEAAEHKCNWADSIADVCRGAPAVSLPAASVASGPAPAGRCDNGQWLVKVTTR